MWTRDRRGYSPNTWTESVTAISIFPRLSERPVGALAGHRKRVPSLWLCLCDRAPFGQTMFCFEDGLWGKWLGLCSSKVRRLATLYQHSWADQTSRYWRGGSFLLVVSWQLAFFCPAKSVSQVEKKKFVSMWFILVVNVGTCCFGETFVLSVWDFCLSLLQSTVRTKRPGKSSVRWFETVRLYLSPSISCCAIAGRRNALSLSVTR